MGKKSQIQWTEASWNPWHGCRKVSAGCKYCYMYRDKQKYGQDPTVVTRSKTKFNDPLKWKDPKVIFTCSWSDWFIEEADAWRDEAWAIIKATPQHTYQILTKRPERIADHLPADWGEGYPNVWLGVSVENQEAADDRITKLIYIPASVRFLSCEPLLGPVNFNLDQVQMKIYGERTWLTFIDWVIVGGESGNDNGEFRYRECKESWIADIVAQCISRTVPVFVKQMGTFLAKEMKMKDRHGGDIAEFPPYLAIREFPNFNQGH